MGELLETVKAKLYERISHPLSATFVLSWLIINWRFLVVLFCEIPAGEPRLEYIDRSITFEMNSILFHPLAATLLLNFVYFWPAEVTFRFNEWTRARLLKIKSKYNDQAPISQEKARELRSKIREMEAQFDLAMDRKETEISDLTRELETLRTTSGNIHSNDLMTIDDLGATKKKKPQNLSVEQHEWLENYRHLQGSKILNAFISQLEKLTNGGYGTDGISEYAKLNALDLIEMDQHREAKLTKKGKYFALLYTLETEVVSLEAT